MKRNILKLAADALATLALVGCGTINKTSENQSLSTVHAESLSTGKLNVIHETKFNSSYADITIDEMLELGFKYGDSCDVEYSNGVKFEDIPFYDGYYNRSGSLLICAYQGYPHVQITMNNSSTFWEDMRLSEDTKVTISLHERAKYLTVQETFSMKYENEREKFKSDEEFGNFRAFKGAALKENALYRGASPFNNAYNRAKTVNDLLEKNNINFILDLADSEEDMSKYFAEPTFESTYAKNLYDEGHYAGLNMGSNFRSEAFATSLLSGLNKMADFDGPFYIHCTEGKDRTGFVCTLLACLGGATYEEMKTDYMITYENYFGLQPGEDKYNAVVNLRFDEFLEYLSGSTDANFIKNTSYIEYGKDYLRKVGMTDESINKLHTKITNYLF